MGENITMPTIIIQTVKNLFSLISTTYKTTSKVDPLFDDMIPIKPTSVRLKNCKNGDCRPNNGEYRQANIPGLSI